MSHEQFGATAIRLDGAFNPAIVTPDWLLRKGLIDESDRDYATEPEQERTLTSSFFSGTRYPWIVVEVSRDDANVTSTDATETAERLREFIVGLMGVLPETPVHHLSVMHFWHVATGEERLRTISEVVAPAAAWDSVLPGSSLDSITRVIEIDGSSLSVSVQESNREGYELYVSVRRLWHLGDSPGVDPAAVVEMLDARWNETLRLANAVLETTLGLA